MLAARRDPPLHVDARDAVSPHFEGNPAVKAPKAPRFVTVVQMMASLLAVPGVGPAKLERYGDDVLELVERHVERLRAVA